MSVLLVRAVGDGSMPAARATGFPAAGTAGAPRLLARLQLVFVYDLQYRLPRPWWDTPGYQWSWLQHQWVCKYMQL